MGLAMLVSCGGGRRAGGPPTPGFNLMSQEQDVQIGREAAAQVRQQYPAVDNQVVRRYVDQVGRRLVAQPAASDWPQYDFTVLHSETVNAMALPGGPVFLTTGMLRFLESEPEVAGVLAHEIAHVVLRHGTSQASKAQLAQIPAALAGAVLDQGAVAQIVQVGLGAGLQGLFLHYSREAETEADAMATRIMAQAGYDPEASARVFEKLERKGGSGLPEFLSSHPDPGNRVQTVRSEIRDMPPQRYGFRTGEFERAKAELGQIPPGPPLRAD
jgi:predicted Zn-dependent protease